MACFLNVIRIFLLLQNVSFCQKRCEKNTLVLRKTLSKNKYDFAFSYSRNENGFLSYVCAHLCAVSILEKNVV
jgi:hypothetical protein